MDGDSLRATGYLKLEREEAELAGEVGARVCDAAEVTAVCVCVCVCPSVLCGKAITQTIN